jgi:nucleoside-diphosphate-sugar epimerase
MTTPTEKRALVTGATGFIGAHLVRALVERGWSVRALARSRTKAAALAARGVGVHHGDLTDPRSLRGIGEGVAVVFHAAAQLHVPGISDEAYDRTNVRGTRHLVEAIRPSPIRKLVALSSIAAIGIREAGTIDERFPCRPDLAYGRSKLAAEQVLTEAAIHDGLPAVILRPPTVYGPGERYNFLTLCRAIRSGWFLPIGRAENRIPFCWVGNVVEAMIAAAERGRVGEAYLISDEPALTFRQVTRVLSELVRGRPLTRLHLPVPLATICSYPVAAAAGLLGVPAPLSPGRVRTMSSDMCFDLRKARVELGYRTEGSFRDLARRTIEWYVAEGLLRAPR